MSNAFSDPAGLALDATRVIIKPASDRAASSALALAEPSFAKLVMGRRSIRRYRPEPVEGGLLERILTQAIWAPSAHNRQPWRFALVVEAKRRILAGAMAARLRRDRLADGDNPKIIAADVARSIVRLTETPALVLACLTMSEMDRYPDARRAQAEFLMAVQSTAMAVQNVLLAACNEGLGSCVICAPLFCADAVAEALDLPQDWQPQCLITIGWPANAGKGASRRPISEVLARTPLDADS